MPMAKRIILLSDGTGNAARKPTPPRLPRGSCPTIDSQCCAQACDVRAPARDQRIGLRIVAFASDAPLAECELVLRVHQRRRNVRSVGADAASLKHPVTQDVL